MTVKTSYWNQWLGRAGKTRWSNYYELLQLPVGFDDPQHVAAVADRLLARVRSCDPGDRKKDWQKVITQLESAKAILTTKEEKTVYDQKLRQTQNIKSSPPSKNGAASPRGVSQSSPKLESITATATNLDNLLTAIPLGTAESPTLPHQSTLQFGRGRSTVVRARRRRSHRIQMILSGLCGLLLIAAVILGAGFLLQPQNHQSTMAQNVPVAKPSDLVSKRYDLMPTNTGQPDNESPAPVQPDIAPRRQGPRQDQPSQRLNPMQPIETSIRQPPPESAGTDNRTPVTPVEPTLEPLSPAEAKFFAQHLRRARQALTDHQLTTAIKQIDIAKNIARDPRHLQVVERLAELSHYVDEFWGAVGDGLKDIKPNQELVIGNTTVLIIDISDNALTLRFKGMNRKYGLNELPAGLAMRIAESWLDENSASSKVVKGAFLAVYPDDRTQQAKSLWLEAQQAGANCSLLLESLNDRYEPEEFLEKK